MKKQLPIWSVVAAIGVAAAMVIFVFTKSNVGEPNREELLKIRGNMRSWGGGAPAPTSPVAIAPPDLHSSSPK